MEVAELEAKQGDIRIVISDGPDYAYAGGSIHLAGWAAASDAGINGWESPQGEYAYSALMHELGHAIRDAPLFWSRDFRVRSRRKWSQYGYVLYLSRKQSRYFYEL